MDDQTLLETVRLYIEKVEVKIDGEWGMRRTLKQLINDGEMPELYTDVLRRIGAANAKVSRDAK